MIKVLTYCLLGMLLIACKSTVEDVTVKPGTCYKVEYIAKPQYTAEVSKKVVAAINRFNNCDFIEAQTILGSAMPKLANDNYLLASYRAQIGAFGIMKSSLTKGDYQQVISSSQMWTDFVKIDNDPRIIKELYIAYRMLENEEKQQQISALAFKNPDEAESYFAQWHQKKFPQSYQDQNKVKNATLALQELISDAQQSMNDIPRSRHWGKCSRA
jgi:hypothetical protein